MKIFVDILMYFLFIILMGHHITENFIHEVLGTILLVLFIIHHILNIRYFKTIFKGKYNTKRTIILILDILLFFSMIGIIISAINISSEVFAFLEIPTKIWGRKLHMLSTSWGFVFMSMHVGMHLSQLINNLRKKIKVSRFEYVYYLLLGLILVYGIYSFIKLNFISDMFLLNAFKYYDFGESPVVYYLHVIASSLLISVIMYFITNRKKERK